MTRTLAVVGLAAVAIVLATTAACGGGDASESPLTKEEYAARANEICAELLPGSPTFPGTSDLEVLADFMDEALPVSEELLRRLSELTPPPELTKVADERFAFAEEQFDLSRMMRDAARRGDREELTKLVKTAGQQQAREERLHRELGWTECGSFRPACRSSRNLRQARNPGLGAPVSV